MNAEALHALFVELLHARDDDAFRALLGYLPRRSPERVRPHLLLTSDVQLKEQAPAA